MSDKNVRRFALHERHDISLSLSLSLSHTHTHTHSLSAVPSIRQYPSRTAWMLPFSIKVSYTRLSSSHISVSPYTWWRLVSRRCSDARHVLYIFIFRSSRSDLAIVCPPASNWHPNDNCSRGAYEIGELPLEQFPLDDAPVPKK